MLALIGTLPVVTSAAAQYELFWQDASTSQEFRSAGLDGSNSQALFTAYDLVVNSQVPNINDMAVDPVDGKLYWAEAFSSGRIQRSNLDGSNIEVVIPIDGPGVIGLALDLAERKIYWSSAGILRANLDGSNIEVLVNSTDADSPRGIAGFFGGYRIFWVSDSGIKSANLNGGDVQLIVPSTSYLFALDVDAHSQRVYWTDLDAEQILSARFDGSDVQTLITTSGYVTGVAIGDDGQSVYWSHPNGLLADRGIWRCNIDGTNDEQIVDSGAPWTLTLYSNHVQPSLSAASVLMKLLSGLVLLFLAARAIKSCS